MTPTIENGSNNEFRTIECVTDAFYPKKLGEKAYATGKELVANIGNTCRARAARYMSYKHKGHMSSYELIFKTGDGFVGMIFHHARESMPIPQFGGFSFGHNSELQNKMLSYIRQLNKFVVEKVEPEFDRIVEKQIKDYAGELLPSVIVPEKKKTVKAVKEFRVEGIEDRWILIPNPSKTRFEAQIRKIAEKMGVTPALNEDGRFDVRDAFIEEESPKTTATTAVTTTAEEDPQLTLFDSVEE